MIYRLSCLLVFSFFAKTAIAQNTYLPLGSEEYYLLDRLETKAGAFSNLLFSTDKGVARKDVYDLLQASQTISYYSPLSNVDHFNINRGLSISGEWAMPNSDGAEPAALPWFHTFYTKRPDFLNVNKDGFFFVLNPVLRFETLYEKEDPGSAFLFHTTQGIEARGRVKDFLGYYFLLTNNLEEPLNYQEDYINHWEAMPGTGTYQKIGKGYRFLKFRGYLSAALIKDHISLDLGYDQHFIGDGIRSLFLSDFSEGAFFVALKTKIWKLNYENLYLRLQPQSFSGQPETGGYKYATIHHLSVNLRPWLNLGLFESVTFARDGGFEIGYMNPVIFYRALERSMGSPDKVAVGLNAKAIALRHLNFYGQFVLNEFTAKQFFGNKGYWANKWGLQLGLKYYDVLGLPNLDLQGEINLVRPYTYTHSERVENQSIANYSHFNQPLAHPLGAGFREAIGQLHYQPLPRLTIDARAMFYQQGTDTGTVNFGNNIFKDYKTRSADFGIHMINGPEATCMMYSLQVSYELRPRLNIDLGGSYRSYKVDLPDTPEKTDLFFQAGFRLNLNRRYQHWY